MIDVHIVAQKITSCLSVWNSSLKDTFGHRLLKMSTAKLKGKVTFFFYFGTIFSFLW